MRSDFLHIDTWVFDLDNTLYPPQYRLFDQIEDRMRKYVAKFLSVDLARADELRAKYWADYGTTLAGLMAQHGMPPEDFLSDVHDIDFSVLPHAEGLFDMITALPWRKIVYTNGTRPYARQVLAARGMQEVFDNIFGVEHADFIPKPHADAFDIVFEKAAVTPETSAMFEDEPRNLSVPASLGMRTVLITPSLEKHDHVDIMTETLTDALSQIQGRGFFPTVTD